MPVTISRRSTLASGALTAASLALPRHGRTQGAKPALRRKYVDGPFGQIHLRVTAGPKTDSIPVLCLHTAPLSGAMFDTLLSALGEHRHAVAPDLPGYGDSDAPTGPPAIEQYASAMASVLASEQTTQTDVLGYGTGASVALALARAEPERIRRVVLVEPPVEYTDVSAGAPRPLGPAAIGLTGAHLEPLWRTYVWERSNDWALVRAARVFADAVRRPAVAWWGHAAAARFDTRAALDAVAQPVFIIDPDDRAHNFNSAGHAGTSRAEVEPKPSWGWGAADLHADALAATALSFFDGKG